MKNGLQCVQGLVNMFDTREEDATLCVYLKSHLYFEKYANAQMENFTNRTNKTSKTDIEKEFKSDFVRLDDLQFFKDRGCVELRIQCPAGSLVLWDSRTLHQGSQPLKTRQTPNIRSAIYICMVPTHRISEYAYSKKVFIKRSLEAVENMRTTNHYPQYRNLDPKIPTSRFRKIVDPGFLYPDPPKLTGVAWQLATGVYTDADYKLL